jgi:hypothetical protein
VAALLASLEAGEALPADPRVPDGVVPEAGPAFVARWRASRDAYNAMKATTKPGAAALGLARFQSAAAAAEADGLRDPTDVVPAPALPPDVDAANARARRVALLVRRALVDGDPRALPKLLVDAGLVAPALAWRDDVAAGADAAGWGALWAALGAGGATLDPGPGVWVTGVPHVRGEDGAPSSRAVPAWWVHPAHSPPGWGSPRA